MMNIVQKSDFDLTLLCRAPDDFQREIRPGSAPSPILTSVSAMRFPGAPCMVVFQRENRPPLPDPLIGHSPCKRLTPPPFHELIDGLEVDGWRLPSAHRRQNLSTDVFQDERRPEKSLDCGADLVDNH